MKTISAAFFIVVYLVSTAFGNDALLSTFDRETLQKIRRAMEGIETVSGDFSEEKRLVMLKEPVVLKGRFYYIRPDRLRWEHLTPEIQGIAVSNGHGSKWLQDASKATPFELDSAPAIRRFVDQVLSWIRGDFDGTTDKYRIAVSSKGPVSVVLTPISEAEKAFLDRILITFSSDLRHVQSVDIHEKDGDASRIRFTRVQINRVLEPGLFP